MTDEMRRELTVALGNVILLKLVGESHKSGRLTDAQFEVVARCMDLLLKTYEAAYPVSALDATVDEKVTKH